MSQHSKNDIALPGEGGWRVSQLGALGLQCKGFGRVAGVDGEGVSGGEEARGHGGAHDTNSHKSNAGLGGVYGFRVWGFHGEGRIEGRADR